MQICGRSKRSWGTVKVHLHQVKYTTKAISRPFYRNGKKQLIELTNTISSLLRRATQATQKRRRLQGPDAFQNATFWTWKEGPIGIPPPSAGLFDSLICYVGGKESPEPVERRSVNFLVCIIDFTRAEAAYTIVCSCAKVQETTTHEKASILINRKIEKPHHETSTVS